MAGGGRKSLPPAVVAAIFAGLLAVVLPAPSEAKTYIVGDAAGWSLPSNDNFYEVWSQSKKFRAGDHLLFNFKTTIHTVVEVTKLGYESCSQANPLAETIYDGPAKVKLTQGSHYYICDRPQHCFGGMKLAVNVSAPATNNNLAAEHNRKLEGSMVASGPVSAVPGDSQAVPGDSTEVPADSPEVPADSPAV
ncbi:Cucumber peeling cupredoxin [Apostasia shenzhenica]|uniref:Cucumber peeling cupredoxin n=1 Tax=Apostasia shenzhenica TaxID=1088818 RepID=A0A2I0B5X2_9ASPA|nr:Cucumber peeling cupredoxin [Apostasia shenzhenica]